MADREGPINFIFSIGYLIIDWLVFLGVLLKNVLFNFPSRLHSIMNALQLKDDTCPANVRYCSIVQPDGVCTYPNCHINHAWLTSRDNYIKIFIASEIDGMSVFVDQHIGQWMSHF